MVEWIDKLSPILWHGLLVVAAVISFLNIQRHRDRNWLWVGVGFTIVEASLLFRAHGPSLSFEGGSWGLSTNSSLAVFLVKELGIVFGAFAIALGLFVVGKHDGV